MSKETEKALKAVHNFLEENGAENMSMEEANNLLQQFMAEYNGKLPERVTEKTAETADDFLELADQTDDINKAKYYVNKAMELEPDNLDAINASLDFIEDQTWEYYQKLSEAVKTGTRRMEKEGLMAQENIGHFWGILETRPYMRLLARYVDFLIKAGMMNRATAECEEMLRLSENDNLGMRYRLMHLYTFLEKEEAALKLHERYDSHEETQMLLPLSILYFKMGEMEKAEEYLLRLKDANKDTKKFFRAVQKNKLDQYVDEMDGFGYRPFTIQELIIEMMENGFLFKTIPLYMEWAYEITRRK